MAFPRAVNTHAGNQIALAGKRHAQFIEHPDPRLKLATVFGVRQSCRRYQIGQAYWFVDGRNVELMHGYRMDRGKLGLEQAKGLVAGMMPEGSVGKKLVSTLFEWVEGCRIDADPLLDLFKNGLNHASAVRYGMGDFDRLKNVLIILGGYRFSQLILSTTPHNSTCNG